MMPLASSESETILAQNAQAEDAFVKGAGFVRIEGGRESHDFVRAEHSVLLGMSLQSPPTEGKCSAAGCAGWEEKCCVKKSVEVDCES
jgi:hypothetical protein